MLVFVLWRGNVSLEMKGWLTSWLSQPTISPYDTCTEPERDRQSVRDSRTPAVEPAHMRTCQQSTSVSFVFDVYADTHTHTHLFLIGFWQKQYNFEAARQTYSGGDNSFALKHKTKTKTSTHTQRICKPARVCQLLKSYTSLLWTALRFA